VAVFAALVVAAGFVYGKRSDRAEVSASAITLEDPSDRRDFIRSVEKLSPFDRVDRVMAKMRELNPGFDGKEKYTVEDDFITELSFSSEGVKNLWPLCALQHLRVLRCPGDAAQKRRSELSDLSPLAELPLEEVDCSWTNAEDLSPLSKLKLKSLNCSNTRVRNLAALKSLPLTELDVSRTGVSDLTPLKGMSLTSLRCKDTKVRDLSPLRDMPIKTVAINPDLIRNEGEVIRSWKQLETLNDSPPRTIAGRFLPRGASK
jgi:hypothetical protein